MALLSKQHTSKFGNDIKYMERVELSETENLQSMVMRKHATIAAKDSKNTDLLDAAGNVIQIDPLLLLPTSSSSSLLQPPLKT